MTYLIKKLIHKAYNQVLRKKILFRNSIITQFYWDLSDVIRNQYLLVLD